MTDRETHVDVAVIGGGPAGASTAIQLATFGLSVALFEKGQRGRQHTGESLPSSISIVLDALDVELPRSVVVRRPPEHFVYWGSVQGSRDLSSGRERESSLLVWRGAFDEHLLAVAAKRGCRLILENVRRARAIEDGYEIVYGDETSLTAGVLVDASGRAGLLARELREKEPSFRTLALTAHYRTQESSRPTLVEALPSGWVWSAPLSNGLRDVTVMVDAVSNETGHQARFEAALEQSIHVRSRLDGAAPEGPVRGIDATPYAARRFFDDRLLLVGDAASSLDPLSAHGVHKAMDGALVAGIAVRTRLERPGSASAAEAFYNDRESRIYRITRERLARLYAQEHRFADEPFWRARSAQASIPPVEVPAPKVPLHAGMALKPAPGVSIVEAPVLERDFVEAREVLTAPGEERPARYMGPVCLPDLFRQVVAAVDVAEAARGASVSFERAYAAIDWLYRSGYLEEA